MKLEYIVTTNNLSINQILHTNLNISSRLLSKLIKNNYITVNGLISDTRNLVSIDDIITLDFNYEEDNSNIIPNSNIILDIVYEDEWLLIVDKPAGIPVHPSILHFSDSLCNGVRFYFDKINLKKKIRPVNRLDLDTSGLVIFAKCEYIQECLIKQMMNNIFKKEYLAICEGILDKKNGVINSPIARKKGSIIERCISDTGQTSITHFNVLKQFNNYCLVSCILETGRTHQIRVHMASIFHPLLGDTLYGSASTLINRQALHCYNLNFIHPITSEYMNLKSNIPLDFKKIIE